MNEIKLFAKQKGDPGRPQPIKGLLQSVPSPLTNYVGTNDLEVALVFKMTPKRFKDQRALWLGHSRPSGIKRIRHRMIQKARFMDRGSYEYSQYWRKQYGKFRRNATRYSRRK